jgi:predicted nucleic acid-binding protein
VTVFVDTSVLVAAVLEQHPDHEAALSVVTRIQDGKDNGLISGHSLAEVYSTLTRMPAPFRHSPEQALLTIEENFLKFFKVASLSGSDYASLIREAAATGIQGGTIYDAVHLKSAAKEKAQKIYTLNLKHFQAIAPVELTRILMTP